MDQSQDKFAQLSPVLELVYVMLTNMSKYMDVYATDIEADKTEQYKEAKDALTNAIKKFDALYGLKSPASAEAVTEVAQATAKAFDSIEPSAEATPTEVSPQPAYDFASGSDPESLKKAKQAVEELKSLFSDVRKEEVSPVAPAVAQTEPAPALSAEPLAMPQSPAAAPAMPTFVSAETAPVQQQPVPTPTPVVEAPATTMPTPMNTQPESSDGGEIDSILAELKKLQNKGSGQL